MAVSEVKIASPIAVDSARSRWSIALATWRAVGGGRHEVGRGAGEGHQAEVDPPGQDVDELLGRLLHRAEAVGLDVGGLHRQRDVDGHHDRRPLPRHAHLGARHGQRDDEGGQAQGDDAEGQVPPPARPLRHDRAQQRHVGEPRGVGLPAQLQHDVERDQRGDHQQGQQPQRRLEAHREAPPLPARRRSATKRTTSISQSRSVRSCRWPAPARRRAAAICARCAAAPVGEPRPELGVAGRHLQRLPGLGVDDGQQADVGQLQLPRVEDLDRQQLVPGRQRAQRALPVAVAEEVRHDDDQAAAPRGPAQRLQRGGEVTRAGRRPPAGWRRPSAAAARRRADRAWPGSGRPAPPW